MNDIYKFYIPKYFFLPNIYHLTTSIEVDQKFYIQQKEEEEDLWDQRCLLIDKNVNQFFGSLYTFIGYI